MPRMSQISCWSGQRLCCLSIWRIQKDPEERSKVRSEYQTSKDLGLVLECHLNTTPQANHLKKETFFLSIYSHNEVACSVPLFRNVASEFCMFIELFRYHLKFARRFCSYFKCHLNTRHEFQIRVLNLNSQITDTKVLSVFVLNVSRKSQPVNLSKNRS